MSEPFSYWSKYGGNGNGDGDGDGNDDGGDGDGDGDGDDNDLLLYEVLIIGQALW